MKISPTKKRPAALRPLGLTLALLAAGPLGAQEIQWQQPAAITGDTDVLTNGVPVYAYNWANASQTVNGVTFAGVNNANAGGNVSTTLGSFNTTTFTSTAAPFSGLSAAYKAMLVGAAYATSTAAYTVTLSNLLAGHAYAVQFWVSDPRGAQNARTVTLGSLGGTSVTLNFSTGPGTTAGYPGQYCVGLFTNYGAPQTFTLQSTGTFVPQMNALQVLDTGVAHDANFGTWTGLGGGAVDYTTLNFATNATAAPLGTAASAATVAGWNSPLSFGDTYADGGNILPVATGNLTVAAGGVTAGQINFLNTNVNYVLTSTDAQGLTGAATIGVLGTGTVTFAGPNTYSGGTVIADGTLQIGNGGTNGSLGTGPVADYGALVFNRADNVVVTNALTGIGTLTQAGAGTLVLSNALVGGPHLTLGQTGAGALVLAGTNTFGGTLTLAAGTVNVTGNGPGGSVYGSLWAGGATGTGAMNFNSTGTWTIATTSGSFLLGGTGSLSDTGAGAFNLNSGTVNFASSGVYLTLGNGGPTTYGSFTQSGGTLNINNTSGTRVGFGGLGSWVQSGGVLNCTRYFAIGGNNANGNGVATFTGGSATISASYRLLIPDAGSANAVLNLGTEAGGAATITHLSTTGVVLENNAGANGTLNLNSGTLQLGGPIFRNNSSGGSATLNLNGATLQGGVNNATLINKTITAINVYKGGVYFDTQAFTNTVSGSLLAAAGNGIYPANGGFALPAGGGGAGYIGAPLVTVTGGSGVNATAIATVTNGAVTGVVLTCPGQNYLVGDSLGFSFAGGGAATPANTFNYVLQAGDLAPNAAGGLTKIGTGTLLLTGTNLFTGNTIVGAGTLNATVDGALGLGNVIVASGAVLTLGGGQTNGYLNPTANLALNATATVNLNFTGGSLSVNGLSTNGGLAFLPAGVYGGAGSGAANILPQLKGTGTITATGTPFASGVQVALTALPNPAVVGQPVVLTATVSGSGAVPTGTITFLNGNTVLGTVRLNSQGIAVFTTTFTATGSDQLSANYSGNNSYSAASVLAPVGEVVNPRLDLWSGAKSGLWDITTTSNWFTLGATSAYADGDAVQFDDSATGGTAVALSLMVKPNAVLFTNNTKNYSLSGPGGIAGAANLTLVGAGTVTLNNTNPYTGNTVVSNGVLILAGGGSLTGGGQLAVGGGTGTGVLNLTGPGTLATTGYVPLGGLSGDSLDTGSGAIYQSAGTNNLGVSSSATYLELGAGGTNAYGYYSLSGGVLNALNATGLRVGSSGVGVFDQSGGVLNLSRYLALGSYSGASGNGGFGVATFTGGSGQITGGYRLIIGDKPYGVAVFNQGTQAGGTNVFSPGNINFLSDNLTAAGTLNLNSGTLQMSGRIYKNTANAGGVDTLNLNGGTIQLTANVPNVLDPSLDNVVVYNGGLVLDTAGYATTSSPNLQAAQGNGIYPAHGTLTLPAPAGGNYLGAPIVTVSGGSGSGAYAVATVANGVVTAVVLTCPGQNYLAGDALTFSFMGGGTTNPAAPFQYTLQPADLAANNLGGVIKLGAGVLTLDGNHSLAGNSVVSNGVLEITGSLNGAVVVAGGTLMGGGNIAQAVTVNAAGTLGAGPVAGIGQLTVSGNVALAGKVSLRLDNTGGNLVNDSLQGVPSVTYGGVLTVTDLTSDGTPLALGTTVTLFNATTYSGAFTGFSLPPLGAGLAWSTANLSVDGSIKVIAINLNPPTLTQSFGGGLLTLGWPADHLGWTLRQQTNHLANGLSLNPADWAPVAGSSTTNKVVLTIDGTKPTEFYRLTYP